jgi:hypothetical protein
LPTKSFFSALNRLFAFVPNRLRNSLTSSFENDTPIPKNEKDTPGILIPFYSLSKLDSDQAPNGLRPAPHALRGVPALGRGRRSRPTGKMLRRRKLLGIAAEAPASGARFVGRFYFNALQILKKQ